MVCASEGSGGLRGRRHCLGNNGHLGLWGRCVSDWLFGGRVEAVQRSVRASITGRGTVHNNFVIVLNDPGKRAATGVRHNCSENRAMLG